MKSRQSGFTLIELVMVIVILGILAASAIPKFVNLNGDANQAAVDGMAGALGSASAINYAVRSLNVSNGVAVTNCDDLAGALEGGLDSDYKLASNPPNATTKLCTLTHTSSSTTATFVGHVIS